MYKIKKYIKNIILILLLIINLIISIRMIYALYLLKNIETIARICIMIIITVITSIFIYIYIKKIKQEKTKYIKIIITSILYVIILLICSNYILKTYKIVDNLTTSSKAYSTSLISLVENESYKLENIGSGDIGIISDTSNIEGNIIPNEIIKENKIKNKIKNYDSYINLLEALYSKEIDYAFVPTNYVKMFITFDNEKYETIEDDTKIIYSKDKIIEQEQNKKNTLKDPFTILIMGVDSEKENLKNSSFNGDALMLLTFNPKTLNTTIMSIPRDSYVPIACFENKMKNKITHAAMYGEECMINTIEDFTGIDIDYYVKINFKGVVKIVDKLGGITVDVPYSFCEQNSDRLWGENTIYVKKGIQTLNGEQALALSRNRKNNTSKCSSEYTSGYRSDFVRGDNQQLVLKATINKLKEINNLNTIYDLLEIASNNIETNMNTNQILSLYNIAKDLLNKSNNYDMTDLLGFQKLYLSGYDARLYDERTGLYLYDYVLYEESIKEVSKAMKVNLELEEPEIIKTFSFDINEEVEEKIIGKGNYQKETLPSFIGKTEAEAKKLSSSLNLKVTIKYLESSKESGIVLYQNYSKGTDINKVSNLILTVSKKASINNNKQTNNKESEKEEVEEKQNDDDNLELDDITGIEGLE